MSISFLRDFKMIGTRRYPRYCYESYFKLFHIDSHQPNNEKRNNSSSVTSCLIDVSFFPSMIISHRKSIQKRKKNVHFYYEIIFMQNLYRFNEKFQKLYVEYYFFSLFNIFIEPLIRKSIQTICLI